MRIWTQAITEKQWADLCKILKGTLHEMEEFPALVTKACLDTVYVLVKGPDTSCARQRNLQHSIATRFRPQSRLKLKWLARKRNSQLYPKDWEDQ